VAGDTVAGDTAAGDTAAGDSAWRYRRGRRTVEEGDSRVHVGTHESGLRVAVRVPKDSAKLANSPDLPASVYESGEELFGGREIEDLKKELGFGLQAHWAPQRPKWHYGFEQGMGLLRYNRVEGLAAAVAVDEEFGRGYTGTALARFGTADAQLTGEVAVRRGDGRRSVGLGLYRRLESASDWGNPLGLGPSLSALLFSHDEGVYYRTRGAELTGAVGRGAGSLFTWRLFAEQHGDARTHTQFSLANAIGNAHFRDIDINAENGRGAGLALRLRGSRGLDPHGFRLLSDLRAEGAAGDFDYVRGMFDATVSHGLGRRLDGALTLSAGTSGGHVPAQRLWYLGGSQTIRGQNTAVAAGNSYWMARAELGSSFVGARPVVFYDVGWAGSRDAWQQPGRLLSGVGVGASILDGLMRFDVAKGIYPSHGWRSYFYLEARF
jgi:hypothetical protein